ncbi:MAG TPA: polyprenyl synthetase family protein [Pyrinomonadaceae bacterium]
MSISETDIWTPPSLAGGALRDYVDAVRPRIEDALAQHLPCAPAHLGGRFNEAIRYALFPGGKRLRPVLTLLGAELVGGASDAALRAATAVEYVHTSSLIFDDLPCMDDASERRGRLCLHRRYDEGLAVLVALALMNASYGLVFDDERTKPERAIAAHAELVACIGTDGMVTGQTIDLSDGASRDGFDAMRNLKTSALMRLSVRLGAILSGAHAQQLAALSRFAELLGEAYQISDDVIDLAEDAALAGSSARLSTLAFERGVRAARRRVASHVAQAKGVLVSEFGHQRPTRLLCEMADYITTRKS